MLQNVNISSTAVEHQDQDVFDCQGDSSSCISKDNAAVMMISDCVSGADHKNVTSSAASVSSFCPEVLEKSMNCQSTANGSPYDQCSVKEVDQSSMRAHKYSNEAALATLEFSGKSDPSETSFGVEQDGAAPSKDVPSESGKEQVDLLVAKMTESNVLGPEVNEKICMSMKTETRFSDGNPSATDSLNSSVNIENLKSNAPTTNTQEPPLQSEDTMHSDGSDELVDVRVCDFCGDAGREHLLALCSKCNDGAEHIYCMTFKMEKVPEGDWMCEECMLMQEPKRQRQACVDKSGGALKPSSLKKLRALPTKKSAVQHVGETRTNHSSKASSLAGKRLGPDIGVRSATKKRTIDRSVGPLNTSVSGCKTRLTRVSSQKHMDKGKDAASQVSSFGNRPAKKVVEQICSSDHQSPKSEQFCGGSLCNSKSINFSDSNTEVQRSPEDIHPSRTAKEGADSELTKDHPDRKVLKSLSLTGVSSVPSHVSNTHSHVSTTKDLRYGSGRNSTEKHYSVEKKTNQPGLLFARSSSMKVNSSRTKVVLENVRAMHSSGKNVEDKKAIQVNGNSNVKAFGSLAHEGKDCASTLVAISVGEKKLSCHSSYAISPTAKNVNAYPDLGASLSTQKIELGGTTGDENDHSVASCKIVPFDLQPVEDMPRFDPADMGHMVPSGISAVPESRCIWKGAFKLERAGNLPNDCCGVQAHLSTCASSKVVELVPKFSPTLLLKEVARLHIWPTQFQKNDPTEQDIALYFFAEDLRSYGRSYKMLLEGMTNNDLALEADFDGFQLLVFPSSLLPVTSQRWNSLPFLWGVFRVRKMDDRSLHLPSLSVGTLSQGLYTSVTYGSESKFVSASVVGSSSASHTSHNSIQGPESVDPVVLRSSALTTFVDQSFECEVSSLEKFSGRGMHDVRADTITFAHDLIKEETFSGRALHSDALQKGNECCTNQDMKSISKTTSFPCDQSSGKNMASPAVDSRGPSFPNLCDSASEFLERPDVASRSSFSIDSGPSGSSDGAKSADEAQLEQLENPLSYTTPNLDLSLRTGSEPEGQIDLNLVLGFPNPSEYRPQHCTKDGSNLNEVSLALSLGMSCSNG